MSRTLDAGVRPPVRDERFTRKPPSARLLGRPEIGSLGGAIVIYVFFFAVAEPFRGLDSLATILYASSTLGIPAVGVALLKSGTSAACRSASTAAAASATAIPKEKSRTSPPR